MAKCRVCKKTAVIVSMGYCADCSEMAKVIMDTHTWVIKPKQFRNKITGEIATQISLMDIGNWEEA